MHTCIRDNPGDNGCTSIDQGEESLGESAVRAGGSYRIGDQKYTPGDHGYNPGDQGEECIRTSETPREKERGAGKECETRSSAHHS